MFTVDVIAVEVSLYRVDTSRKTVPYQRLESDIRLQVYFNTVSSESERTR